MGFYSPWSFDFHGQRVREELSFDSETAVAQELAMKWLRFLKGPARNPFIADMSSLIHASNIKDLASSPHFFISQHKSRVGLALPTTALMVG